MRYFVTLFDSNYLTRGLVMYKSLLRHAKIFHLWVICFDDISFEILTKLNLPHITPVSLQQFEDEELLKIKPTRSPVEYFWTCTPSTCLYVLSKKLEVDCITYLDADLMFFANPEPIFQEMGQASILLTEHRYLPEFDKAATNGLFNVQFMTFRRDYDGLQGLNWWREKCLEWCYARSEEGKFGDQKYLDIFPEKFNNVHLLQHLGAGLAPWNSAKYNITKKNNQILVEEQPLIFYHFNALKIHPFKLAYVCPNYPIYHLTRILIYQAYLTEIKKVYQELRKVYPNFNLGIVNLFDNFEQSLTITRKIKILLKRLFQARYMYCA